MPTTSGGLVYPAGSDPANVPAAVQALADSVDSLKAAKASPTIANPAFTGAASFPDGSAAAPSITNTGDTDTGIAFPADNAVQISTAGTARVYVNASGNVGVGTTSPGTILHTSVNAAGSIQLLDGAAAANEIRFRRYNSTVASPTIVADTNTLGAISFQGYDGAQIRTAAQIAGLVAGTPGASDMPGALQFLTTPDGGISLTERQRIDNAGLITGTGTSLGAWTAYTPTLGGTGWALGNGTTVAAYCQVGKIVHFRVTFTFGSTSTFGAAAAPTVSLPVASVSAAGLGPSSRSMGVSFFDASLGNIYYGRLLDSGTSDVACYVVGVNGLGAIASSTAPFTWANGDLLQLSGTYQAA